MADGRWFVGLDVGGTTMKAAVVGDDGAPKAGVASLPTEPERGQEAGLARMAETIRLAAKTAGLTMSDVAAVGVATPGLMDIKAGLILDPPNLKPWRNVQVPKYIAEEFCLPTAFQNDANAAALGEYWTGAGKEAKSMVLFTLGTGVGGGIIIDGKVLEGEHSHGGEVGHVKIEMTNPLLCGCGRYGCLEAYAGAAGVVKRTREALFRVGGRGSELANVPEDSLTAQAVFEAADRGDALADRLVDETAYYLAVGATNLMNTVNPDTIVYGGGMIAAGERFLERIRGYIRRVASPVPAERTKVRYAKLGSDAGFIGAAACAKKHFEEGEA